MCRCVFHTLNLYSITHQLYLNLKIKINKQEGLSFSSLPSGIYNFSHGPQIIFYTQISFEVHTHTQWYHTAPVGIYLLFSLSISWISFYASTYGANKVFCSKTIPCCAVLSHLSHVQLFATPGSSVHGIAELNHTLWEILNSFWQTSFLVKSKSNLTILVQILLINQTKQNYAVSRLEAQ